MTYHRNISTSISRQRPSESRTAQGLTGASWQRRSMRLCVCLLMLFAWHGTLQAQKVFVLQKDSIPLFRGFQVTFDLLGAGQRMLSDYGQYEGSLRINLHDQWFPVVEIGIGTADTHDEATEITYKTTAPYFRGGIDFNLMKNKHADNRIYGGFRYAFTSYKVDLERRNLPDPVWQWDSGFRIDGQSCYQHWAELVFGIDAKIFGPLHLGWTVRYRRRLFHNEGDIGRSWYVPGYGTYSEDKIGGTFNVIIDI